MTEKPKLASVLAALLFFLAALPAAAAAAAAPPAPQSLRRGAVVPPLEAESLRGPSCHRMIPVWNRAYERRPNGLRVYGVLLDKEPPGFFMAMPISFPVLRGPASDLRRSYKLAKVPLTLRVGPGGAVLDVGLGQIDAMRLGELFRP
jgi:hypothetical protein